MIYVAEIVEVRSTTVLLHYDCKNIVLANAVFRPCWHEVAGDAIQLADVCPEADDWHPTQFVSEATIS